jgi:hypothetical protein
MPSELIHWLPPSAVKPSMNTPMHGGIVPAEISASRRCGTFAVNAVALSHCTPLPVNPWRK